MYQKQGAGTALIKWGINLADKEGTECYVESSPAARRLCVRSGFRHLAEMRIELGKFKEGYLDYRHSVMLRLPYGIEEPPEPPPKENPFDEEKSGVLASPVSPLVEEEEPYTAEAQMLEFRSSSSLRSVKLMDTRSHSRSKSKSSSQGSFQIQAPPPLPKTPRAA